MQSKITFNKIRSVFKAGALTLGFVSLFGGLANAQFYVNGPLSTGATSSNGTAAPAGYTWSEVQAGNTSAGFGANITAGYSIADDFTVPAGPSWNITTVKFYAYSTGYAGATSPFNDVRVQIFNTDPSVGSPTPVWGDLTSNRFASSTSAMMYRIFTATPGTTRRIWEVSANINTTLAPGTYWMEWQLGNGGISNFSPAVTIVGQVTQPGFNAKQCDKNASSWTNLLDGSNAMDMPFRLDYSTGPCAGTPTPGNTVSSASAVCPLTPFNLSLQNLTPGSGVTYQWQSAPAATGPWTNIAGATNSTYSVSAITATTFYQALVTCSGNTGTSTPVQVTLNPPSACYCIPSPGSDCSDEDVIENVTVGGMSKTSTCAASGYSNYTTTDTASLIVGGANPISVTTGDSWTEQVGVWVDYDRSGSFEASEFTNLGSTAAGSGGVHAGAIAVPAGTATGYTRMRVRVRFSTALTGTQACLGYAYGETEDYTVNLIPCVPVTVTTQPANQTANCGNNATFTVALAGSLPSGYWQYRTSASGVWLTVPNAAPYSGVNTTALTITMAPYTLNGYQYRFLYQGACAGVNPSNAATLTVNPLVGTVAKSPAGSICEGSIQQLSITNTQPATTLTFNSAANLNLTIPDDGSTTGVNNTIAVSGIPAGVLITDIKVKMNITHAWAGDLIVVAKAPNNKVLNLSYALNATGGAGPTTGFQPTYAKSVPATGPLAASGTNPYAGTYRADGYNPSTGDPTVPTGPDGYLPTSAATTRNTFDDLYPPADNSSTLNGNWTLAMYDYFDDGTTANKFNSWSIEITYTGGLASGVWTGPAGTMFTDAAATVAYTGTAANSIYVKPTTTGVTNYSVVVSNGVCTSAPLTVPVAVNKLAASASAVAAKTICDGGSTYFKSTVDLSNNAYGNTYQWQVSTDNGATYTDVANAGVYSGANTDSLVITGASTAYNGYRYRLHVTAAPCAGEVNSTAGTLTVNPLPILTVSANPYTAIYPGQTTTLTVASSTTVSAGGYQWYRNGVAIPGATANTLVVDVDGLGTYTVTANDVNACGSANTPSITITEAANDILFIYPSPNSGQFQVRYYSQAGNTVLPRTLNIYDTKGARVYSKQYAVTVPYTRMDVDLSNLSAGLYQVELLDRTGARIKTGKVLIQK